MKTWRIYLFVITFLAGLATLKAAPTPAPDSGAIVLNQEAKALTRFRALHRTESLDQAATLGPKAPFQGPEAVRLKHPVVLAHGAIWLDALGLDRFVGDYWKGTVEHFWKLGIPTIAPEVPGGGSIRERAEALKKAINASFPKGKVHIVAHSMGGLDARYMITMLGMSRRVASLTTVSTPHHGSWYASFADKYILKGQGLDLLAKQTKLNYQALQNLSVEYTEKYFNPVVTDAKEVDYYSYAGVTSIWNLPITEWGAKLVMTVAEKTAAGRGIGKATKAALEKAIPGSYDNTIAMMRQDTERYAWIDPAVAGQSDGVVSVSSAKWGRYLGEIHATHTAQIGSNSKIDHISLWEGVIRNLQALGH